MNREAAIDGPRPRDALTRAARALLPAVDAPASRPRMLLGGALGTTVALLPFEEYLGMAAVGPLTVTGLEVVWGLALIAWLAVLLSERRRPALPWPVVAALGVLLLGGLASAALAGPLQVDAFKFLARSVLGWSLFAATVDVVRSEGGAARLIAYALGGAVVAAALGLLSLIVGPSLGLALVRQDYSIGDVARLQGSLDYPNTAAMMWEATGLAGLALLARAGGGWPRLLTGVVLVLVTAAMLLTLSRGATLGAVAGLGLISLLALLAGRRRLAIGPLIAGTVIVAATVGVQLWGLPIDRLLGREGDRGFYDATYEAPPVIAAAAGTETEVQVEITNASSVTWNQASNDEYRLGYRWLDGSTGEPIVEGSGRTEFRGPVRPSESVTVTASVTAPADPGEHLLAWDLVHEGAAWFSEKGVSVATSHVVVDGQGGGEPVTVPPGAVVELFPGLDPNPDRSVLWQAALAMIGEQPILGTGPGTYRVLYGDYLGWDRWNERIHANNMYLELGATTGLLGLAAFMVLVLYALSRQLWQLVPGPPAGASRVTVRSWLFRAAVAAAVIAFLVHGFVDYFLAFNATAGLFWVLIGLGLGLALADADGRLSSARAAASADPARSL